MSIETTRLSEEIKNLYAQFGEEDRLQFRDDFRTLMKLPEMRRVLMGLLWKEHVFGRIGESGEDQTQILIEVGRHNMAQDILTAANIADPQAVALATRERNELLKERHQRIARLEAEFKEGNL